LAAVIRELGIVGDHPSLLKALEVAAALATADAPVLIVGETGTGKELIAKLIHRLSGRPADRFIPLNCAALPRDLVESVLFGHKRGAFTGAVNDQLGKFDLADGGTLFLDELGELPIESQGKLLRVLQDGVVEPLGVRKGHRVNVRVVAATNADLSRALKQKKFREDLYYRLPVLGIHAFDEAAKAVVSGAVPLLSCRGKGALATGLETTQGFVVKAGSQAILESVPSMQEHVRGMYDLRNELIKNGVLVPKGNYYEFSQDYVFSSPSTAAAVVLGRSANGRLEWKDGQGNTLKALQEK
jgi:hypothetical protein